MRKVIGVMPLYDDERDSYWMVPGYLKMLEAQGAVPLILPLTADRDELQYFLEICGGFLMTGGHDVSPSLYHATPSKHCGACCGIRDEMERYIWEQAVAADRSVLGICRGIQMMNVVFGGTLYQDLPTEYPCGIDHHMTPPYDRAVHSVLIREESMLFAITGQKQIGVNSYHHQAVRKVSPLLEIEAVSEDGLTEAVSMPGKRFVLGVQWHPEFSYQTDENSCKIVEAFVASVPEL